MLLHLPKEIIYNILEYTNPNLRDIKSLYCCCANFYYLSKTYYTIIEFVVHDTLAYRLSTNYVSKFTTITLDSNKNGPLYKSVLYPKLGIVLTEYSYFKNNKIIGDNYMYDDRLPNFIIINKNLKEINDNIRQLVSSLPNKIKETDQLCYKLMFSPSIGTKTMLIRHRIPQSFEIKYVPGPL
jgi:hypothetical protein